MSIGKACLGCAALVFGLPLLFGAFTIAKLTFRDVAAWRDKKLEEKARRVEEKRTQDAENARIAEARRIQEAKDEKVQVFALKEAPKVWDVYQSLQSEIDVQGSKIEELRKTLETFGKVPEQDTDFIRICALRDEMIRSRQSLRTKLEDAYIAAKKYEASPSRKDYQETMNRAIEDGINDANMAAEHYKAMTRQK